MICRERERETERERERESIVIGHRIALTNTRTDLKERGEDPLIT